MSFTLGEVITSIRLKHPAFGSDIVPSRVLGEALGLAQQRLAMSAIQKRPTFLSQVFNVALALTADNTAGVVGAGTTGGLPSLPDSGGTLGLAEQDAGIAPVYDLSDPVVLAASRLITAVVDNGNGTTTLTFQGSPGWTVNGFVGQLARIVDGPGQGQMSLRVIAANTANAVTVTGTYEVVPAANQSVGAIIAPPAQSSTTLGVYTGVPAFTTTAGYLVKLDANGTPYLDVGNPVLAQVEVGIPLPPMHKLLGVTALWNGVTQPTSGINAPVRQPCAILPESQRTTPTAFPAVVVMGGDLYLCGYTGNWANVQSLDVRYSPIPPMFSDGATAVDEYFLLPDYARDALVHAGAAVAADWAVAKGETVDMGLWLGRQQQTEAVFLRQVGQTGNIERFVTRRNR